MKRIAVTACSESLGSLWNLTDAGRGLFGNVNKSNPSRTHFYKRLCVPWMAVHASVGGRYKPRVRTYNIYLTVRKNATKTA